MIGPSTRSETETGGRAPLPRSLRIYQSDMSATAILVYQYLLACANKEARCWPKHKTIAAHVKRSVSTVKRALKELERGGFVEHENRRRYDGSLSSNLYRLV